VGWNVTAYPADYNARHWRTFRPALHVQQRMWMLSLAIHEWVGLAMYRHTGKTNEFFPAP
jgi:hypothetical protein